MHVLKLFGSALAISVHQGTLEGGSKELLPYYPWICVGMSIIAIIGIIVGIYAALKNSHSKSRTRWYSWCLFCDQKGRRLTLTGIRHETYSSFGKRDQAAQQIVLRIFQNHSKEDVDANWDALPGAGMKTISSCPNIYGAEFGSATYQSQPWKARRSSSSTAPLTTTRSTLVIIDEDTEEEEEREDLFL
mmetsp:Transcript_28447/g.69344  ORF Transcript_28447/g.69344 Transcript_28447/m.69344 type:complete len:189 (-) Transcript_28447:428-994(-)